MQRLMLQIDEDFIGRLRVKDPDALAGLSIKLVSDLKEVLERLNQNPTSSSRSSGSLAPRDTSVVDKEEEEKSPRSGPLAKRQGPKLSTGPSRGGHG